MLDRSLEGVVSTDDNYRIDYVNPRFARLLGYNSPSEIIGRDASIVLFPEDLAEVGDLRALRRQGINHQYERRLRRKDGSECWVLVTACVDSDEETGEYRGTFSFVNDLTERKQAEEALASAYEVERTRAEREAILNEIGDGIRRSVEPEVIEMIALRALGNALGLDHAYLAEIDVEADLFAVRREWRVEGLPSLMRDYPISSFGVDIAEIFRDGQPCVVIDTRPSSETRLSDRNAELNEQYNITSLVNVPFLDAKGQVVGALCAAMSSGAREWKPSEISLMQTVASQLRSALDAARSYSRERNIASHLQRALLPNLPSEVPGLLLSGMYHAALEEAGVGGDFTDIFKIDDARSAIVVADLSGKGLAAASQVATVRNMVRYALYDGYCEQGISLREALDRTNAVLAANDLLLGFATLFVGVWNNATSVLTYVNAGQEPGLIWRESTHALESLPPTGPVFGTVATVRYEEQTVTLNAGDVLAIFTDGITECGPSRRELLGIEVVSTLFQQCCDDAAAGSSPNALVDPAVVLTQLLTRVEERASSLRDDLCAVVCVRHAAAPDAAAVPTIPASGGLVRTDRFGLHSLTTALLNCVSTSEVVDAVVEVGCQTLGARAGLVALISEDGEALEVVRTLGYAAETMERWLRLPLSEALPLTDCFRRNEVLVFTRHEDWLAKYARVVERTPSGHFQGAVTLPLSARENVFGALHITFETARQFSKADLDFLVELSRLCALALDRAMLLERAERSLRDAQRSNARLQLLARAGAVLGGSLDYRGHLKALMRLCVPEVCDWASVDLMKGGKLRRVGVSHRSPELEAVMRELQSKYSPDQYRGATEATVIETGQRVYFAEIPDEMLTAGAIDDEHARLLKLVGVKSVLILPIAARGNTFGAITLGMGPAPAGSGRSFTEGTIALAEDIANRECRHRQRPALRTIAF